MATLLIDMDDTILPMIGPWVERYNEKFNTSFTIMDVTTWNISEKFGEGIFDILEEEGFFANLVPYENAVEVLERLSKKHNVIIVTASVLGYSMKEKGEWVKKHLPFLKVDNFCIFKQKNLILGDLLFDDAPHNVEAFPGITVSLKGIHNTQAKPDHFVSDMLEFEQLVEKIYG